MGIVPDKPKTPDIPKTVSLYNTVTNQTTSGTPEEMAKLKMTEPEIYKTYKERTTPPETPTETPKQRLQREKDLAQFKLGLEKDLINFRADHPKPPDLLDANQRRLLSKDLLLVEEKIIANPEEEAVRPAIDMFNKYADGKHMYLWKKVPSWGRDTEEAVRVQLPIVNGKQVTPEEVRSTAKQEGKTVEEILILIGAK